VTLVRATFLDTPTGETALGAALRADTEAALRVVDGIIVERRPWADLAARHPDDDVLDLREGLVLPGLVDTHVHYPQVRVTGALGLPLLEWLDAVALPEEARLSSPDYARAVAREFVAGLVGAGTTTALVFGSHFARAVDVLFEEVQRAGLRVTAGLVVGDRGLPEPLLTTPERAYDESVALARRWHRPAGSGASPRPRYAVTPRFSYAATDGLLESCRSVLEDVPGSWFTSHVNESPPEIAAVASLFPDAADYVDTYDRHGLVGPLSVLAHNVHPTVRELSVIAGQGATVAHCPTSNAALGSGLFPLRAHVDHGVRVSLGSDVGAGTGFSLFKEGLQAHFAQQLLGDRGLPLAPADLLHLATRSGALALGLDHEVGDLSVGKAFDVLWLRPTEASPLALALRHADSPTQALARVFALAGPADVAGVWVAGQRVTARPSPGTRRCG
jgi:guanine deaminase